MYTRAHNGGFPEPPAGEPQRLVRARHAACGAETRVRLPSALPARAVRQVVCDSCEAPYECDAVEELRLLSAEEAAAYEPPATPPATRRLALSFPRPRMPAIALPDFDSRLWRYGSVVIAAVAVIGILALIQSGGDDLPSPVADAAGGGSEATPTGGGRKPASTQARFVSEPGFSLALPPGWERIEPEDGAAFAAQTVAGNADAKLWISEDPNLSFREFELRSLAALESLAGTAEVTERVVGPTLDETRMRLHADAPAESGVSAPYDVTLRAAGPYRYYLSTSLLPGASDQAAEGVEMIHGSFQPESARSGDIPTAPTPSGETSPEPGATP